MRQLTAISLNELSVDERYGYLYIGVGYLGCRALRLGLSKLSVIAITMYGADFLTPGVVIFPIIYWIVEGDFPTLYFALMFAGWFGLRLNRG